MAKDFLEFTDEDVARLESLRSVVDAREEDLVDAFLDPIHEHDRTEEILDRSPRDEAALGQIVSGYLRREIQQSREMRRSIADSIDEVQAEGSN